MSTPITKWQIYCNTEQCEVIGFLDSTITAPSCCFNNNTHSIDTTKSKFLEHIYRDTMQLTKWKVHCDTEGIDTFGYSEEIIPPMKCFNNDTHIVSQLPTIVEKIYNNTRRIKEETIPTGNNFGVETIVMDIPSMSSAPIIKDHWFAMPINLLNTSYITTYQHNGDKLEVEVSPYTTIGTLPDGVTSGVTAGITVSQSAIDYLNIGYFIDISDGVTYYSLGRCTAIDLDTNKISVEYPTPKAFASGSYIDRTVKFVNSYTLCANEHKTLGTNKIGGSYFPAKTVGRLKYTNMNGLAKKFTFGIEYLY